MKKKLLLSSVAALTLFAAYNTANAEDNVVDQALNIANSSSESAVAHQNYVQRQNKVDELRTAHRALGKANKNVEKTFADLEKAEKEYYDALKISEAAKDSKVDATSKKTLIDNKITALKADFSGDSAHPGTKDTELKNAKIALDKKNDSTNAAPDGLKQELTALEVTLGNAKDAYEAELDKKLLDGANEQEKETHSKNLARLYKAVKDAEKDVNEKKEAIADKEKEIKKLEEKQKATEKELDILKKASDALKDLAVDDKIDGTTLTALDQNVTDAQTAVTNAKAAYTTARQTARTAKTTYETKLKETKDLFATQNVAFNLAELLVADEPAQEPVTKFGWNKDEKGDWTYVVDSKGTKATGWVNDKGTWYYLNAEGVMQKWWVKDNGTWYYLNGSGAMQTGWVQLDGTWYYLNGSGAMVTGWFEVSGKWYYAYESGALAVSTTVGEYNVNENGEWV